MGSAKYRTCVQVGNKKRLLDRGETLTVDIVGDPLKIQRIIIDGRPVLLGMQAGANWAITINERGQFQAFAEDLHEAARRGSSERVAQLITSGFVQPNARNVHGAAPLHLACGNGRLDTARLLLRVGADVDAVNKNNSTPLHVATRAAMNAPELVTLLAGAGAIIDARDHDGATALHRVVNLSREDCRDAPDGEVIGFEEDTEKARILAETLLSLGADVNATDNKKRTPLHIAAAAGNLRLVRVLLLSKGTQTRLQDASGKTAAQLAEHNRHEAIACEVHGFEKGVVSTKKKLARGRRSRQPAGAKLVKAEFLNVPGSDGKGCHALQPFSFDRDPVTSRAYDACVGSRACPARKAAQPEENGDQAPAVGMSWDAAGRFCKNRGLIVQTPITAQSMLLTLGWPTYALARILVDLDDTRYVTMGFRCMTGPR